MKLVWLVFANVFAGNVFKLVRFVKNTLDSLILGILTSANVTNEQKILLMEKWYPVQDSDVY